MSGARSRSKGQRGERAWRDELREAGWMAHRGRQFQGSPDSPDVVCPELECLHFEVKACETLSLYRAMEQAEADAGEKVPVVAHRRNRRPWLVVLRASDFFRMLNNLDLAALANRAGEEE